MTWQSTEQHHCLSMQVTDFGLSKIMRPKLLDRSGLLGLQFLDAWLDS